MKSYQVIVRENVEELVRDRGGELVEKRSKIEHRQDLGFSVVADVAGDAVRRAKEQFAKSEAGRLLLIRSCTIGPGGVVNMVVCRHRVVARPPKGWAWKKPPASPEPTEP
jgi:hypothetical protein